MSDTKIADAETGDVLYDSKILTLLQDTLCVVGLAGYVNLFSEFNRKIHDSLNKELEFRISKSRNWSRLDQHAKIYYVAFREKHEVST